MTEFRDPQLHTATSMMDLASPRSDSKLSVALQILDTLHEYGVDTIFGVPGGAIISLYGALVHRPEIRIVTAKHETGAVFLAMGHALATGRLGVVLTTAGPGITNAITGIAAAFNEDLPILVISGEATTTAFGRGAFHESSAAKFDAVAMVRRCTKFAAQVLRPDSAIATLHKAIDICLTGRRGPAFLSVPLNIASVPTTIPRITGSAQMSFEVDGDACRRAMALLLHAKRPLILAGSGCRSPANRAAVRRLAEATRSAVAVTPKAKGVIPEDHPQYLGLFGFAGHDSVTQHLKRGVDVLLVCGSSLNDFATNAWSSVLTASSAFLQIDIDAAQLGHNYPIDLGLVGPVDRVIEQMLHEAPAAPRASQALRTPDDRPAVVHRPTRSSPSRALTNAEVVMTMNEACPADAVFVTDMGEHMSAAFHYFDVRAQRQFVACLGLAAMGSGVCAAIGYQMAAPSRRVYAVTGDGCFLMQGSELATAVQHRVPVTILVNNDSRMNMCELAFCDLFGASPDVRTQVVDFAQIARAMGATAYLVRTHDELVAALKAPADGTVLLDVRIDPAVRFEGNQRIEALRAYSTPQ